MFGGLCAALLRDFVCQVAAGRGKVAAIYDEIRLPVATIEPPRTMNQGSPTTQPAGMASPSGAIQSFQSGARRGVAWVVFGLCLVATGVGHFISLSQVEARSRDRFQLQISRVLQAIQDRMSSHEQVLKGAAGLFAASQSVERREWHDYVHRIDIDQNYEGIRALGYIERVPAVRAGEFVASNRLDGPVDFEIWPPAKRSEHWVVKFVEPESMNASALGYDISSDPIRTEAAKVARDEGRAAITRRIQLVQMVEEEPAVLLLLPIYRNGPTPENMEERQVALQGWVYGAFVMDALMDGLVESRDAGIDFEIFDDNTNKISLKTWIYDADRNLHATNPEKCTFHENVSISMFNRIWSVHFNTRPAFDAATDYTEPRLLLIGGVCISFLLFGITQSLASTRQRALGLAGQMTEKFRIQERAVIASSNGIFITDASSPHNPLLYANPAMERILGRTTEELSGQGIDSFLNVDPQQPALRELRAAIVDGRECRVVLDCLRPNQTACWLEVTLAPVKDAAGIINHYVGIAEDITERRHAEETLRATNALQRAILDSAGYAVISTSPDGLIRVFNAAAERMTGYKAAEVIGRPTSILIHDWADVERRAYELSAELGRPVNPDFEVFVAKARLGQADEHEWTYVRKDGTKLPVLLSVTPVRDEHGVILGFMGIASDITERKRGEAQLQQATQAAEAANRAKGEFLANMSHEIRTPMNAVIGMTELALGTALNQEQRGYLVAARRSASDLLTIIDDVLDFSKIEAGKLELHLAPFRLRDALEFGLKTFKVRAAEKQLELDLLVEPDVPDALVGDAARLRQVVNNLVGNALKFTGQGRVTIEVKRERESTEAISSGQVPLHFTVTDTGIGVPPDKRKLIFGAFTQADASVTRRYGGTGLGLAIADKLSHLMGGTIWVDSEVGKGSRFHFTAVFELAPEDVTAAGELPEISAEGAPGDDLLRAESDLPDTRPLRVLLAEDNPVNRELATTVLDKLGHSVVPVSNGREAVEAWERGDFDLILMDVQMPAMDGLEATTVIRQREKGTGRHIPIVGLTAHAMKGDREQGLAVGMDEYVTKPLRLEDLVRAIRKWIPAQNDAPDRNAFQHAKLLRSLGGDEPAMRRLVGIFLETTPPLVTRLRAAAEARDVNGVMHAAHTLKGSLSHLHEIEAHAAAVELEQLARVGNLDGAMERVAILEARLGPFEESLRAWLGEGEAAPSTGRR